MANQDLLRGDNVADMLAAAKQQVRADPAAARFRVLLFQLLAVTGEWDKALSQLEVVGELDAEGLPMVHTYREAMRCEALRAAVFRGERSPLLIGEPEPWIAMVIEALRLAAQGHFPESQELRERAFEQAPATAGQIDGQAFEWIADADQRLGPLLEVIVNGKYYWAPFHRISSIQMEAPADLRDVVWMPGEFTWASGGTTVGLIPTRYPGSEKHADGRVQLSRMTVWEECAAGFYLGYGQRLLTTDGGEYPLMDTRRIELTTGADASAPDTADA